MHFFALFFRKNLVISKKSSTFALAFGKEVRSGPSKYAAIAQLVEHDLAKVGVASSSLVCRSEEREQDVFLLFLAKVFEIEVCPDGGIGRRARFRCEC